MVLHLPLHSDWTLRHAGEPGQAPDSLAGRVLDAQVPGCVHTDLLAAGAIPDPYLDDAELRTSWIGRTSWQYSTGFDWTGDAAERVDLVFEGLDTVAEVSLNEVQVTSTRNMHRTYRVDVTDQLQPGRNVLDVHFGSPYAYAEQLVQELGARPNAYPEPFNFIRKMACNFGWDWGPTLVTSGIWRPVSLQAWSTARLARVRPLARVVDGDGTLEVLVDLERTANGHGRDLVLAVAVDGREERVAVPAAATEARVVVHVDEPRLWWPAGLGEQPLYGCEVRLLDPEGEELDRWERRIGFRDVTLDTSGDEQRSAFTFVVNGVPLFAKGVNWIPDDCFPTRVTRERCAQRLRQAVDLGVNLVRVWGGGVYESEDFYDLCDELGLMVWQDFPFACAAYPEEEPLWSEVEAEARDNVARLVPHPSLVLWNGNNENIWGHEVWSWGEQLDGRTWGEAYYLDLLPGIVGEVDPSRPYYAGSPWSGRKDRDPNDPDHGCMHIWNVWNGTDYLAYRDLVPPFVSEFGWQAPPTWATLRRAISEEPLRVASPMMLHHQKAIDGQLNLDRGLAWHFRTPSTFDDWHYLTQLNQARALQVGLEHWLASWPRTAGAVIWQLNDCWPVASWSLVDGDGRRKPSWYAVQRAFADHLVTFQPGDGEPVAVLVNHSSQPWRTDLRLQLVDARSGVLREETTQVEVAPRSVTRVVPTGLRPARPHRELMVADTDSGRSVWFDVEDHAFEHPVDLPSTTVTLVDGGYEVTVTTDVLLRDLVVQADRVAPDAEADTALLTLLPGESEVIRIRTSAQVDPELFTRHPVLTWVGAAGGGAEVPCPADGPAVAAAGPLAGSPAPAKAS